MKPTFLTACALAALLLPAASRAQEETSKPPVNAADTQKIREELRNLPPEERRARVRELRQQGTLPPADQQPGQEQNIPRRQLPGGMQPGGAGNLGAIIAVLTPEQRQSLMEANRSNQEHTRELEERVRDARKAVLEASIATKLNEDDLRKKLDAVAKIDAELTILRAKALAKMEPPLSEEQIQQIKNAPAVGNLPQRFQGQRPNQGPNDMQRERLPYGNQPLPPPDNPPGPRESNDRPQHQAP